MSNPSTAPEDDYQNWSTYEHYGVLHRAVTMLQSMGDGRPKSQDKLANVLQPLGKVIQVAQPLHVLASCAFFNNGEMKSVAVVETQKNSVKVASMNKDIWNAAVKRSQKTGAMVILSEPDSELGQQMKNSTDSILKKENLKGKSKPVVINEITKASFIEKSFTNTEGVDGVIDVLVACGYLSLSEGAEKINVKYNLPSDFMLLSIRNLAEEYHKELQNQFKYVKSRPVEGNILQLLTTVFNDCLNEMKMNLKDICKTKDHSLSDAISNMYGNKHSHDTENLYELDCHDKLSRNGNLTKFLRYFNIHYSPVTGTGTSQWDRSPPIPRRTHTRRWSTSSSERSRSRSPSTPTTPSHDLLNSPMRSDSPPQPVLDQPQAMDEDCTPIKVDPGLMLESLCEQINKLSVADISQIPTSLTPEALALIIALEKMGKGKPKSLVALQNRAKLACRYIYTRPLANTQHENQSIQVGSDIRYDTIALDPSKMFSNTKNNRVLFTHDKDKCQCRKCLFNLALIKMAQDIKKMAEKQSADVAVADMQTRKQIVKNMMEWMKNLPNEKKVQKNTAEVMDTTENNKAARPTSMSTKALFDQLVRTCYKVTAILPTDIVSSLAFLGILSHDGNNITYNLGVDKGVNLQVKAARNKIQVFLTELKPVDVEVQLRAGRKGQNKDRHFPGKRSRGGQTKGSMKRMRYN